MAATAEVVVVGGGVVGCACAYFLARGGARVTILEREAVGAGASGHATGYFPLLDLPPGPDLDLGVEGLRLMRETLEPLQEESGVDVLWNDKPVLNPAFDAEEEQLHRQRMEGARYALATEWLDREEALRLEPRLNPAVLGACYQDALPQVDSYRLTLAYAYATERHGGTLMLREAVGLERQGDRATAVRHASGSLPCDALVLAMGAWSQTASQWLGLNIPVVPLRGERLELRFSGEPMQVHLHSPKRGHLISRADGLWSAGSTGGRDFDRLEEYMWWNPQPTQEAKLELLERAVYLMPCLEGAEVTSHLAGVRPYAVDGRPLIGPVPGWSNVFVASGHYSKGIRCSAVTGKIIADLILSGASALQVDVEAFYPARFSATAS